MTDLAARIAKLAPEQRRRLLRYLESRERGTATPAIARQPRDRKSFPLSFAQERLWFLDQLMPGNPFYNISWAKRTQFALHQGALERALKSLVARHEALRTVFPVIGGEPQQQVLAPFDVQCELVDLGSEAPMLWGREVGRVAAEAAQKPFDLAAGPLFRVVLIRLSAAESAVVFVVHHIVADSWSVEILSRELAHFYAAAAAGREPVPPPELPVQYVDFAVWQREWLQGQVLERQLAYWRHQLADLCTLDLPTDRPRLPVQTYRGAQLALTLAPRTVEGVRAMAKEADATPFMVLLTAFMVLLHRYTGQDDLVVGVPIANRGRAEFEGVIGFFANSLVLRADFSNNPSFRGALGRVRSIAIEAYSHQDVPFSTLVTMLQPAQDLSRNPLFQVSFQLIAQAQGRPGAGSTAAATLTPERGTAIFDLVLNLWEIGNEIRGCLEYNTDLFDRATLERTATHFLALLEGSLAAPDVPIGTLPVLTAAEHQLNVIDWNATDAVYPAAACLHILFERQAARTPDAIAVMSADTVLSYAELDRAAETLARSLRRTGAGRECVGVLLAPSADFLIAILAVLKSGNAYVPLDTATPTERLANIIEDASIRRVVTSADLAPSLATTAARACLVHQEPPEDSGGEEHAAQEVGPDDLAYVIFTSGSSGRPKGVMVAHRAVVNYLAWCQRTYPVAQGCGAPLCSPVSSDMSVTTLFLPLISGTAVVLLDQGDVIEALDVALREGHRFSFVKLTPSHLEALGNLSIGRDAPKNTAAFVIGGEALHGETLALWRDHAPDIAIYNEYGPTEATVGCSVHALRAGDVVPGPVPIGRPIANTALYVLDRYGAPVPVNVPGELCIGGLGLARGYIGAPALTAERFVQAPGAVGQRVYHTGDLVRYGSDGTLHYLGRLDRQIKIRGYRIEPSELEALIRQHPDVSDAAVVARDLAQRDRQLVAYVVPALRSDEEQKLALAGEIRAYLRLKVPPFMVPNAVTVLDALPLTKRGKVDTHALQNLGLAEGARTSELSRPLTPLEKLIARVFADVLKVERVAAHDDFFIHLGGHSLLATKVVARLRELLRVELPLRRLFEASTTERLAQALVTEAGPRVEHVADVLLGVLAMTDAQVSAVLTAS